MASAGADGCPAHSYTTAGSPPSSARGREQVVVVVGLVDRPSVCGDVEGDVVVGERARELPAAVKPDVEEQRLVLDGVDREALAGACVRVVERLRWERDRAVGDG